MKFRNTAIVLACVLVGLVLLPACGQKSSGKKGPQVSETLAAGSGPQATTKAIQAAPPLPAVPPDKTMYVFFVRDSAGNPVGGVDVRVLTEVPEPLFMREPRRKTVIGTYPTPLHGRVHFQVEGDGTNKVLWVGGKGITPFTQTLPAASPGLKHEETVTVKITPIANFLILDHQGLRVNDAIVSMAPPTATSNAGYTERSGDAGFAKFTREPGLYKLIATKGNGTCRFTQDFQWDGNPETIELRLPEKTPGK
ncbi:MAG TPA: hypothetical protein VGC54_06145 [Planctomycetota bacterium]